MFIILHKVRGEPTLDIAEKVQCPECTDGCDECDGYGYWWICSTSGHRAHPYKWWDIADFPELRLEPPPHDGWPDHYRVVKSKPLSMSINNLFGKPNHPTISRRI